MGSEYASGVPLTPEDIAQAQAQDYRTTLDENQQLADKAAGETKALHPGKAYANDLHNRWNAYLEAIKSGNYDMIGIPQTTQDQDVARAYQQANAGAQAQIDETNRAALGAQGFQGGAFVEAAKSFAEQGAKAAAAATANEADLNQRLIESRIAGLRGEMTAERDHRQQMVFQYLQQADTMAYHAAEGIIKGYTAGMG